LLYIDRTACTGCGVCVDACLTGAISLDENESVSAIEPALCNECLDCLEVCPNDAIQRAESLDLAPVLEGEVVEGEVLKREVMPVPVGTSPVTTRQPGQLATLAGTALSFVGSWLLPRAANALVDAFERRLTHGTDPGPSSASLRVENRPFARRAGSGRGGGRARQRQRRRRGR
jgi:NAD-dependent dihydropyrimidine dehydrogenase PreA subunit